MYRKIRSNSTFPLQCCAVSIGGRVGMGVPTIMALLTECYSAWPSKIFVFNSQLLHIVYCVPVK
jgi:hypothetical protein